MLVGRLDEAIADETAALALEPDSVTGRFSLAVMFDRAGDPSRAVREARAAQGVDPIDSWLSSPAIFFVPAYDRYWYEALAATAHARPGLPKEQEIAWRAEAVERWSAWLAGATPDDRWLDVAWARKAASERALAAARGRPQAGARR